MASKPYICDMKAVYGVGLLMAGWAQSLRILAALEAAQEAPIEVILRAGSHEWRFQGQLEGGTAEWKLPAPLPQPAEVWIHSPGYLPLRYRQPLQGPGPFVLDFTRPENLHPRTSYVEKSGKACLAAGELGSLPEESHPAINAYDLELFLEAWKRQDPRADFDKDGSITEKDHQLILKNQNALLSTEL